MERNYKKKYLMNLHDFIDYLNWVEPIQKKSETKSNLSDDWKTEFEEIEKKYKFNDGKNINK